MQAGSSSLFPFEFAVKGIPVSLQARNKAAWKGAVRTAALERQQATYELGFLDERPVGVTLFYFASAPMKGDIDNIAKPILDALQGVAYLDDNAVEHLVIQKFEPEAGWILDSPGEQLLAALDHGPPFVYVRVDDDVKWRTVR